jgi:hypothetical protein
MVPHLLCGFLDSGNKVTSRNQVFRVGHFFVDAELMLMKNLSGHEEYRSAWESVKP